MPKKIFSNTLFYRDKRMILDILVVLALIAAYSFFPGQNFTQNITKGLIFLVAVPIVYVKFVLKKSFHEFGMVPQNHRLGLFWGGIGLLICLFASYILFNFTSLKTGYSLPVAASQNFWYFVLYELVLVNIVLFYQEFFYKGFVLGIFLKRFGPWAVLIQFFLFAIPAYFSMNNLYSMLPYLLISAIGGWVAYRSRSFFYSYLMSLAYLIIFDAYIIFLLK